MARQMTDKEMTAVQASIAALRASRKASRGMVKVSDQALAFLSQITITASTGATGEGVKEALEAHKSKCKAQILAKYRPVHQILWIDQLMESGVTPESMICDSYMGDIVAFFMGEEVNGWEAARILSGQI